MISKNLLSLFFILFEIIANLFSLFIIVILIIYPISLQSYTYYNIILALILIFNISNLLIKSTLLIKNFSKNYLINKLLIFYILILLILGLFLFSPSIKISAPLLIIIILNTKFNSFINTNSKIL